MHRDAIARLGLALLLAAVGIFTIGALLPSTPLAGALGFQPLPGLFFFTLGAMVITYLALIELGKFWFYRNVPAPARHRKPPEAHHIHRRASRFTVARAPLPRGTKRPPGRGRPTVAL